MVSSAELMDRLRAGVDVLFVPMSFAPGDREYSALSFPSKLTDYTAVGVPLLIHGPDYCSAARWALDRSGVAEVITSEAPEALAAALERLRVPKHRWMLGQNALRAGHRFFSQKVVEELFFEKLASA
jgi:hypothetical protein